ncbi:MAG: tyrosine-type recombinase/integrase [Saprospiraceae bacterium]
MLITRTDYNEVNILPFHLQEALLQKSNTKYQSIFLLMLDCGLRVSEAISLQIKHFNFFTQEVMVKSLKKRGKQLYRKIPMTTRLLDTLGKYWKGLKDKTPDAYIFPPGKSATRGKHINRTSVWRQIKKKTNGHVYPHMLRHTFATRVVNEGNDIRVAQDLLGHADMRTTQIYLHVAEADKRIAIKSIERIPWYLRFYHKFFPVQQIILTPTRAGMTNYHVGRTKELAKLSDLMQKKVNTYVKGPQGVGKSHILDAIEGDKILRMEEFGGKKHLVNLLMTLFEGDKANICSMLYGRNISQEEVEQLPNSKDIIIDQLSRDRQDLTKIINKESVKRLVELAIQITEKDEYTIIIDNVTSITPAGVRTLEKLKNHFHLIVAARNIKIDRGTFLTNFEKIELTELNRAEATELINLASKDIYTRIEDYEAYKNHIWENTNGNPLFIIEMIDRYSKEANISLEITKDIQHTTALKEINMAMPLIIGISALMILRYYGREAGEDSSAFMFLGGIFLVFALFARPLANLGKRKWV